MFRPIALPVLVVLLLAFTLDGSAAEQPAVQPVNWVALRLLAAADSKVDIVPRLLRPEPVPELEEAEDAANPELPDSTESARALRFGVRLGYVGLGNACL